MTRFGAVATLIVLAGLAACAALIAPRLWPGQDPEVIAHTHDHGSLDHRHLQGTRQHAHAFITDDDHPHLASQLSCDGVCGFVHTVTPRDPVRNLRL